MYISIQLDLKLLDKLRRSAQGDFGGANLLDVHIATEGENWELALDDKIISGDIYVFAPNRDLGKVKLEAMRNALEEMPPIEIRTKSLCIVYEHLDILTGEPGPGQWEH